MKLFWSLCRHLAIAGLVGAFAGCGSDATMGMTTGTGGHAGTAGATGSAGTGGSSPQGSAGTGGAGRRGGSGGAGGTGGAVATGTGGDGAIGGRGGSTGAGGSAGTGGAAGAAGTGAGGRGGAAGTGGTAGSAGAAGRGGTTGGGGTAGGGAAGASGGAGTGGAGTGGASAAGTIFVAPNGDDTNPGTMAQPLKTVAKARDVVRGMTANMTADITVYLRGGTYPQTSTLTFGNADSGKNGFYVKYIAYQSERPIITGGKPITGWTTSSAGSGFYSASGITAPFRQLYVNGVKAIRARSPNLGANGAFAFNRLTGAGQHRAEHPGGGVGGRELEQPHQGRDARDDRLGRQHPAPGVADDLGRHGVSEDPEPREPASSSCGRIPTSAGSSAASRSTSTTSRTRSSFSISPASGTSTRPRTSSTTSRARGRT